MDKGCRSSTNDLLQQGLYFIKEHRMKHRTNMLLWVATGTILFGMAAHSTFRAHRELEQGGIARPH